MRRGAGLKVAIGGVRLELEVVGLVACVRDVSGAGGWKLTV